MEIMPIILPPSLSVCSCSHFLFLSILFLYQSYKKPILPIDILTFIISIVLAQVVFYTIINQTSAPYWVTYISAVGTFIFFGCYMTLTLAPLKSLIFKDLITGKYGFRAHRDLFKSRKKKPHKK